MCYLVKVVTVAFAFIVGTAAEAQLISNGSFETIPGQANGQGILPSGWLPVTVSPDTYSNDGTFGLSPGDFGNFTGVTAFDGTRWVAGAAFGRAATDTAVGGESIGTTLVMTLTPGNIYRLDAHLYQAVRPDLNNPGGYHLFLASDATASGVAAAVLLGALSSTSGIDAWESRSLTFVAPVDANSRPLLILAPYQATTGNSYPGIDNLSLIAVPEPVSILLASVGVIVGTSRRVTRNWAPTVRRTK